MSSISVFQLVTTEEALIAPEVFLADIATVSTGAMIWEPVDMLLNVICESVACRLAGAVVDRCVVRS